MKAPAFVVGELETRTVGACKTVLEAEPVVDDIIVVRRVHTSSGLAIRRRSMYHELEPSGQESYSNERSDGHWANGQSCCASTPPLSYIPGGRATAEIGSCRPASLGRAWARQQLAGYRVASGQKVGSVVGSDWPVELEWRIKYCPPNQQACPFDRASSTETGVKLAPRRMAVGACKLY